MNKPFSIPQRQSKVGILVIFLAAFFKILKSLWVLGVYFLLGKHEGNILLYILLGLGVLGIVVLFFSILHYKNFKFHIDYKQKEFVLQKGVFSTEFILL